MDTITRTFPLGLTSASASAIIELCHFRDMIFDTDERVGIYLEAFFCNMSLKSFNLGIYPEFDGDESEAEKMAKFNASENKSQKLGLRILTKKNNTGDWREKAEIILVNRGRKDYFDLLIPYLAKAQVRLLEKNDAIGIQLVDYGNGLLKVSDFIEIEVALRIEISKKNSIEALQARMAALELALEGRLINFPANTLLGGNIALKKRYLDGTSPAIAGSFIDIPHNLDSSKIKGISVLLRQTANVGILPGNTAPGFAYDAVFNNTIVRITLSSNSYYLYSVPVNILIDYIS